MTFGMTFNGVHSSTLGNLKCSPRIPLLPERRGSTVEAPGRDGAYDFNADSYAMRSIAVDCMITTADRATLRAQLAQIALWLSGSGYLIFDHDTTKRWQAKAYSAIDLEKAAAIGRFTVVFEAQPFAEDVNASTGTILTPQDYGSPLIFYPVITATMTGAATRCTVSLVSTGQYVYVLDSLALNDVLVFDMSTCKVTKNGVLCMDKVPIDSQFFGVPPGWQRINGFTNSPVPTFSMSFRKRYLYA